VIPSPSGEAASPTDTRMSRARAISSLTSESLRVLGPTPAAPMTIPIDQMRMRSADRAQRAGFGGDRPTDTSPAEPGPTIGWPRLARTVACADRSSRQSPMIFTSNYGEAGAIDRFGGTLGLPHAFSGHNGFSEGGPSPDRTGPALVVGLSASELSSRFRGCHLAALVSNSAAVENDEHDALIELCRGTRVPWSQTWSALRHLG
jgi:hypothetical protein